MYKMEEANPFNWTGSKFRYLNDMFNVMEKLLNEDNIRVLDVFTGGGDCISKLPKSWDITANDLESRLIELHRAFQDGKITDDIIYKLYCSYGLSKTSEKEYYMLREDYNLNPTPELLYLLLTTSFNNQMRFSSRGFNMPFGKNRSSYNTRMRKKVKNYTQALKERKIDFINYDYKDLDFSEYDFLIIDPPYSNTIATYNESTGWDEEEDRILFDKIDSSGKKFVYFNQLVAKGTVNSALEKWISKYKTVNLKTTTNTCSYHKNNSTNTKDTVEILVTNL